MNVLVLGSGGREHAIVKAVAASPKVDKVFAAPGNGGTALDAQNLDLDQMDGQAVAAYCKDNAIDLVVIGPEAPLVAGVGDVLRDAGLTVFGPGAAAAQLEGSKTFSKDLMKEAGIPTAAYGSFTDEASALAYLDEVGAPIVVKADGLAAGKGVVVAMDMDEAREAVKQCFDGRFGDAGATVVIEERLVGPECSLLAFADGKIVRPMDTAQDHKRALEGDLGPNTGGMGVYSPVPIVSKAEHAEMVSILERTIEALKQRGIEYTGVLYGGFILTAEGPKVLEFNARFGDPETQVLLPRLRTDLVDVMIACDKGQLDSIELEWDEQWAVCVVIASDGYPGSYEKGYEITGIKEAEALDGVTVYHAGTKLDADNAGSADGGDDGGSADNGCGNASGKLVTNGGRVLNVTALGDDFASARDLAYKAVEMIKFEGARYRSDIGARAMRGRDAWEIA